MAHDLSELTTPGGSSLGIVEQGAAESEGTIGRTLHEAGSSAGNTRTRECLAKALHAYTASPDDPNEISFAEGEILDVVDSAGRWWSVEKGDGTTGIAPSNFLKKLDVDASGPSFRTPLITTGAGVEQSDGEDSDASVYPYRARACYTYTASPEDPNEISFVKGELLDITDTASKWWLAKKGDGITGIAPSNYLNLI